MGPFISYPLEILYDGKAKYKHEKRLIKLCFAANLIIINFIKSFSLCLSLSLSLSLSCRLALSLFSAEYITLSFSFYLALSLLFTECIPLILALFLSSLLKFLSLSLTHSFYRSFSLFHWVYSSLYALLLNLSSILSPLVSLSLCQSLSLFLWPPLRLFLSLFCCHLLSNLCPFLSSFFVMR